MNIFTENLKYEVTQTRGYCIVPRQLSNLDAGIQTAHALHRFSVENIEISKKYWEIDPTLIILEVPYTDIITDIKKYLSDLKIPFSVFNEPSLYNIETALFFVVDDIFLAFQEYGNNQFIFDYESIDLYNLKTIEFLNIEDKNSLTNYQNFSNLIRSLKLKN